MGHRACPVVQLPAERRLAPRRPATVDIRAAAARAVRHSVLRFSAATRRRTPDRGPAARIAARFRHRAGHRRGGAVRRAQLGLLRRPARRSFCAAAQGRERAATAVDLGERLRSHCHPSLVDAVEAALRRYRPDLVQIEHVELAVLEPAAASLAALDPRSARRVPRPRTSTTAPRATGCSRASCRSTTRSPCAARKMRR